MDRRGYVYILVLTSTSLACSEWSDVVGNLWVSSVECRSPGVDANRAKKLSTDEVKLAPGPACGTSTHYTTSYVGATVQFVPPEGVIAAVRAQDADAWQHSSRKTYCTRNASQFARRAAPAARPIEAAPPPRGACDARGGLFGCRGGGQRSAAQPCSPRPPKVRSSLRRRRAAAASGARVGVVGAGPSAPPVSNDE